MREEGKSRRRETEVGIGGGEREKRLKLERK